MWTAYEDFWRDGTKFRGRATRPQFWWAILVHFLFLIVPVFLGRLMIKSGISQSVNGVAQSANSGNLQASIMNMITGNGTQTAGSTSTMAGVSSIIFGMLLIVAVWLYFWISMVPFLSIVTRRLRDVQLSGWWTWVFIGGEVLVGLIMIGIFHHNISTYVSSISAMQTPQMMSLTFPRLLNFVLWAVLAVGCALPSFYHKTPFRSQMNNSKGFSHVAHGSKKPTQNVNSIIPQPKTSDSQENTNTKPAESKTTEKDK